MLKEIKWPFGCRIEKNEKLLFTQMVLKWHLLDKRKRAMDQLKEGLNTLNFLERVKQCSDFEMYLVHDQDNCVNSDFIRRQLLPKLADLDTKSENQEQIKLLASNCLMDISDEQSVDLYQFLTSMRDMPSRPQDLHVAFNYQRPQDKFPRAITCGNLLLLPLGNESNKEFLYFFKKALNYKSSFGRI